MVRQKGLSLQFMHIAKPVRERFKILRGFIVGKQREEQIEMLRIHNIYCGNRLTSSPVPTGKRTLVTPVLARTAFL